MTNFRPEIEAMAGYVPGEQPQAGKFIKLNTNENPYPPSADVIRAIGATAEGALARYPDPMADAFRSQASVLLGVPADWILCGNGSDDILTMLIRSFVGQGQLLRAPYPSYVLYRTLAEIQGARLDEIRFESDWSLSDRFADACDGLRLAVLSNPNSPSGTSISPARVADLADRLPCPLVVDEAYVDFSDTNCISLVSENDRVMVTRSLSKSYALAGLRFGYLVAQPHVIAGVAKVKDSYNCDALSIAGATAAIADQAWLAETRSRIIATRTSLSAAMIDMGFEVTESQANFLWCTHSSIQVKSLYERLKAERILVRYMDYAGWGDGLRISVGTDDQVEGCVMMLRMMV
ncbi:MAG: histidinol-phosphate transaminase [Planctomycetales bacterium]